MSEHRAFRLIAIGLMVLVLAGIGLASMQQAAWSEGYMMGLIAGGEGDALAQYVLYNNGRPGAVGGFFGGFLKLGFILVGLLFVGKMVRMIAWRHHPGGPDGSWGHGRWGHPGASGKTGTDDGGTQATSEHGNGTPVATA